MIVQPSIEPTKGSARRRLDQIIAASPLFAGASPASRERAVAAAELAHARRRGRVMFEGSPAMDLLFVASGAVHVTRVGRRGGVVALGVRGAGELLGEPCLGDTTVYGETATAIEDVEYAAVPLTLMKMLVAEDVAIGAALRALVAARLRETEGRLESLCHRSVEGRIAGFVLTCADRWGMPAPNGTLIAPRLPHWLIAQEIGSARETVTVALLELRRKGAVAIEGGRLIVCDRAALEKSESSR